MNLSISTVGFLLTLLILPSLGDKSKGSSHGESDESGWLDSIPGVPNVDYPMHKTIPATNFTCTGKPHKLGFYVDYETGCQVYHICYNGQKDSFLCPVGTLFDENNLACGWWYNVQCSHKIHIDILPKATPKTEPVTEPAVATPVEEESPSTEPPTVRPVYSPTPKFPEHKHKTFVPSLKKPVKVVVVKNPTKAPVLHKPKTPVVKTKLVNFQKTEDSKILNAFPVSKLHSPQAPHKVVQHSTYKGAQVYASPADLLRHFLLSKVQFFNELLGAKQKVIAGSLSTNDLKYRPHLKSDVFKVYLNDGFGNRPQKVVFGK